jgi:adenosine deaminase
MNDSVNPDQIRAWIEDLPKAELHLHLEGAIPLPALWALIEKYGGDPSLGSPADLRRRLTYPDFPSFIDTWIWKNGFLREYDDFTQIAEAAARDLARQNIFYAEMFFSPSRFEAAGLAPQALATAIRAGFDEVPEVETWLIADLVRDDGPEKAARTLAAVSEISEAGLVGIGIGGSEHRHPPEQFRDVFADARRRGFSTSAHAGEAAGPDSVRGAIEILGVDRVGHATRAIEDPAVVDLLAERGTPIELCPLSNVATGIISNIADHPARHYWQRGLPITVNTDDPGMFHNMLAEEYMTLHRTFGFTPSEIRQLILNALDAAWRSETERSRLRDRFTGDPAWSLPD